MDIPHLNNNQLNPQNKTDKTSQGKKVEHSADKQKQGELASSIQTDELAISKAAYEGELRFAKGEYQKLQKHSIEALKEIKQKIEGGVYEQDKIQVKVSERMQGDISSVDAMERQTQVQQTPGELSAERKDQLLNDESILEKVSQKLIDDLSKL